MNTNERFEYMAGLFFKEHGILAPGKDRALPDGVSDDERRELWAKWVEVFYQELFASIDATVQTDLVEEVVHKYSKLIMCSNGQDMLDDLKQLY